MAYSDSGVWFSDYTPIPDRNEYYETIRRRIASNQMVGSHQPLELRVFDLEQEIIKLKAHLFECIKCGKTIERSKS